MPAQAHYSHEDLHCLIDFLFSKCATSADGGGTFKDTVWTKSAELVNKVIPETVPKKGGPKTKGSCKSKWGKLKETFNIVANIKAQSRFKWDEERGADIDKSTTTAWEAYKKTHKGSSTFCNKGWPWFATVQRLMPLAARGANAYQALSGPQQQTTEAQKDDINDEEHPYSDWPPSPAPDPVMADNDNIPDMPLDTAPYLPPVTPAITSLKRKQPAQSSESSSSNTKRPRIGDALRDG
ncbi:hypothetical protein B0H34DRAFT_807314 [Crassisporium funariophilum]|nr:hypothetical protein B0H34DRAFT_807314 [Crassisporium funariophilum]